MSDIEKSILSWLAKNGFPLEMTVARKMAERKFRVTQSSYYTDFETQTAREIDLLARLYAFHEPPQLAAIAEVELFCAIECKSAGNPWVIFRQGPSASWNTDFAVASHTGRKLLWEVHNSGQSFEFQKLGERAGYGVRETFSDGDRAFIALMSALKASESKVLEAETLEKKASGETDYQSVYGSIVIPVIVTTAPLFECTLGPADAPQLNRVSSGSVNLRYPRHRDGSGEGAVVYIVANDALDLFADAVTQYFEVIKSFLSSVIPSPD